MIKLNIDTINHNVILLNAMEDANFTCFKENCLLRIVQLTRKTSFIDTNKIKEYAKQISEICTEHNFELSTGKIDCGSLMVYVKRHVFEEK